MKNKVTPEEEIRKLKRELETVKQDKKKMKEGGKLITSYPK